jgi:hypothetical protein
MGCFWVDCRVKPGNDEVGYVKGDNHHDRLFDLAFASGPRRHRAVGWILMSAEIIQFIPRPKPHREPTDFPTIVFRSAVAPDDLAMDHADTAPCEYVCPDFSEK